MTYRSWRTRIATVFAAVFTVAGCASSEPVADDKAGSAPEPVDISHVVAVGSADGSSSPSEDCQHDRACLRHHYATVTWNAGVDGALAALERDGDTHRLLYDMCHDTTHIVGEIAAQLYPTLRAALAEGDQRCGSGYYHGIVAREAVMTPLDELIDTMSTTCDVDEPGSFHRWECFHGIGHGFVFVAGGRIHPAIELCAELAEHYDRGPCYSGALMQELVDNAFEDDYTTDPYRLCREIYDEARVQCFDMHATMVWHHIDDVDRFDYCVDNTYDDRELERCVMGLGRNIDAGRPMDGPATAEFCGLTERQDMRDWCVQGAAENTFAYYGSETDALPHCDELPDPAMERVCRDVLTSRINSEPPQGN